MKLRDKTDPMAKLWLDYGIDRKLCKKPVMCLPYSLTQYSCRQYIQDHVEKQFQEKQKRHNFGKDLFKATNYLTPIVWESINDVIVGAKEKIGKKKINLKNPELEINLEELNIKKINQKLKKKNLKKRTMI